MFIFAVCNYAKGRWVADSRRPLYSGFECKQWLSEMWACRLTQRTDFSYEGYRWQPENCKMEDFERSAFLRRWASNPSFPDPPTQTKVYKVYTVPHSNFLLLFNWFTCVQFADYYCIPECRTKQLHLSEIHWAGNNSNL